MFCVDRQSFRSIGLGILLALLIISPVMAGTLIGGTLTISSDPPEEVFPSIAYNSTRSEYLVVWFEDNAPNAEIRGQRLSKDGALIGAPIDIAHGSSQFDGDYRRYPDVSYNKQSDEYLVVWEHEPDMSSMEIRARRISGTGVVQGSSDIEIRKATVDSIVEKPAVAYSNTSNLYMVIWQEQYSDPIPPNTITYTIYAQLVKGDGAIQGSMFEVSDTPNTKKIGNPDIAYNRHANRHLVVWEQKYGPSGEMYIRGRQVKGAGGTYGPEFNIANFSSDATNPSVAAIPTSPGNIKFMVVYELWDNSNNHQIIGDFINEDGSNGGVVYPALSARDETAPAVAGSEGAQEYLVVWRENAGVMDNPIKGTLYSSTGVYKGQNVEINGPAANFPAVSAGHLGDFLLAWQDSPIGSNNDIFGALFGSSLSHRSYLPLISH